MRSVASHVRERVTNALPSKNGDETHGKNSVAFVLEEILPRFRSASSRNELERFYFLLTNNLFDTYPPYSSNVGIISARTQKKKV